MRIVWPVAAALLLVMGYFIMISSDEGPIHTPELDIIPEANLTQTLSYGSPSNYNVVGIEPFMVPADYATFNNLFNKLSLYLDVANDKGWLRENTIVLFPEHIGTWLAASYSPPETYTVKTAEEAMEIVVKDNLLQFTTAYMDSVAEDSLKETTFRSRAGIMRTGYEEIFGILSEKYGVTIVAGSTVLPQTKIGISQKGYEVWDTEYSIRGYEKYKTDTPLVNNTFIFNNKGKWKSHFHYMVEIPHSSEVHYNSRHTLTAYKGSHKSPVHGHKVIANKRHPISEELDFLSPSPVGGSSFEIEGLGKISVAICADSWYPDVYDDLPDTKVMLVPSFMNGVTWNDPWLGYNGDEAPDDVDPNDIGRITEGEAWVKYALPYHAKKHGIKWGMNVFLKGQLWDMKGEGRAIIIENGNTHVAPETEGGAIYNLWLNVEEVS